MCITLPFLMINHDSEVSGFGLHGRTAVCGMYIEPLGLPGGVTLGECGGDLGGTYIWCSTMVGSDKIEN